MHIVLVKQTDAQLVPDSPDANAVRRFLFGMLDGCSANDKKAWRRFVRSMNEAGSGEYFTIRIERQRNGKFHRLCFAVLQAVFKAQEVFTDFRIFRAFISLGAGFVDYVPNADGELRAIPKSLSFNECSEEEIRQFFENAVLFLRTARAQKTLFPAVSPQIAEQGMEAILQSFERNYDEQAALESHARRTKPQPRLASTATPSGSGTAAVGPDIPDA